VGCFNVTRGAERVTDEQLDIVVKRDIHRGRIWSAHPQLVLHDDEDELVTLGIPGTTGRVARTVDGLVAMRQAFISGQWELEPKRWHRFVAVVRMRPCRSYNLTHLFDAVTGEFLSWYVSFERPITRHDDGLVIDTHSYWLNLIVLPSGKTFWKDTDHWTWAVSERLISPGEVSTVEHLREQLLDEASSGSGPFDGTWTEWSPIELEPLSLPDYWDRPAMVVDTREAVDRS
jgi:predicted RNA-binding protein associated with RNAse of E/G family